MVHYLTEELVKEGHDVTLFASGDSCTTAKLVATVKKALRLNPLSEDTLAPHIVQIEDVLERQNQFDIIHFHIDYLHFPFSQNSPVAHLTTLHGKLNIPELQGVYNKFDQPVVSISNSQRRPLPQAHFVGTVYHGLPANLHKKGNGDGGYVAFLGRISPEKGIYKAIEWALAANVTLKIAAKVDKADQLYFKTEIEPLLNHPLIEYIGEINEIQKTEFLGRAEALLFPINWNEPFGMVIIEAMSCGTPIIAHNKGSVPEIIEEGKNGFIVTSTEEAVAVIRQLGKVDRNVVRKIFEQKFTAERMALDYVEIYKKLVKNKSINNHPTGAATF